MQKFFGLVRARIDPLAKVIGENKYLVAIRDGFLLSTPLLIVGSVFLLIANFPLPQWDTWMSHLLGKDWATMMSVPASASFDVMTILAVVGIAYSLENNSMWMQCKQELSHWFHFYCNALSNIIYTGK